MSTTSLFSECRIVSVILLLMSLVVASCTDDDDIDTAMLQRFLDREAIELTISRANLGFELGDPVVFASAFADDAVYELVKRNGEWLILKRTRTE